MLVNKSSMGLNCTESVTLDAATRRRYFADIASVVGNVRVEFPWRAIMTGTEASETLQVTVPVRSASGATATVSFPAATVGATFTWTLPDAIMADARAAGLKVTVVFAHPPNDPLADALGVPAAPPGAAQFGTLVRACADRYRDVAAWEMWNEQNLHAFFPGTNPVDYVPYLKAGYQAVKSVNPAAPVLFGGLASCATASGVILVGWIPYGWNNTDPVEFLTGAYKSGAKGFFDALAYHPYSVGRDFKAIPFSPSNEYIADIAKLRDVMAANGDAKPIWVTEYGFDSSTTTQSSELAAQTDYMATLQYVEKAFIYNYSDASGETLGITVNGAPKPSYTWLKNRMA